LKTHDKEVREFVIFLVSIGVLLLTVGLIERVHEIGHLISQMLLGIPIDMHLDDGFLSTTNMTVNELMLTHSRIAIAGYILSGFIFSFIFASVVGLVYVYLLRRFKLSKEYVRLIYLAYFVTILLYAVFYASLRDIMLLRILVKT
jgi:hypothetical protein